MGGASSVSNSDASVGNLVPNGVRGKHGGTLLEVTVENRVGFVDASLNLPVNDQPRSPSAYRLDRVAFRGLRWGDGSVRT
jgi:hypothetical protein